MAAGLHRWRITTYATLSLEPNFQPSGAPLKNPAAGGKKKHVQE